MVEISFEVYILLKEESSLNYPYICDLKQNDMVFYFTGTGNSLWVADAIGKELGEPLISLAAALKKEEAVLTYALRADERIVFVYPVHSWGPALPVMRFISRLTFTGYDGQPVYSVCTCGDECGYTLQKMRKALAKRCISLTAGYSVQMPNNYILLPGFSVDPPEVEKEKLVKAPEQVAAILRLIKAETGDTKTAETSQASQPTSIAAASGRAKASGITATTAAVETSGIVKAAEPVTVSRTANSAEASSETLYHQGSFPFLKSCLIYPLFATFAVGKNAFYATDACISCGLCARICPTATITWSEGSRPQWGDTCVQCVACIHRCPVRAIEYGQRTQKKGRYFHPQISKLNTTDK